MEAEIQVFFSLNIVSTIIYSICAILCIVSIVLLDKKHKTPRILLGLNLGFCLAFLLYCALWFVFYFTLPHAITLELFQQTLLLQTVALIFLAASLVFYFVKFLIIVFSWIKIIATQVEYKGNIDLIRKIMISFLAIWMVGWLVFGYLFANIYQLVWLAIASMISVAIVPISMTIVLIVYSSKIKAILSKMLNVEKGQDLTRTVTILSIVYIVACNLHVIWLVLSLFVGIPVWTIAVTFYVPQYLVCITTIWFLTPLRERTMRTSDNIKIPSTTQSTNRSSGNSSGSGTIEFRELPSP